MSKQLYIIRHGQTDYNLKGIVQGRGINSSLNSTGHEQAKRFYEYYRNLSLDSIYTSTQKRTIQTVEPFKDLGLPQKELIGLDELDWGIFEGKAATPEIQKDYRHFLKSWRNGQYHVGPPEGESPEVVAKRQLEAIQHVLEKNHEKQVLLCMHGRAMRILLCQLMNLPLSKMDEFEHSNTCLYLLEENGRGFSLVKRNNTDHLSS